ncbi:LamG domain-containing protein [Streptomyces sp. NPDC058657]|uniref:LamG domain-containing protein n=1 Tax=unclassified Streptomyces TaxID=2593676 RepID=UPI003649C8B6
MEVHSARTEYTSTAANPDGTFTLTQTTTPQRAKADDGTWRPIDTTLERRTDGSVGPKSAVVDLGFSGGGDGKDLIRLGHRKGSMGLGWPSALPAPTLEGATATYPEVFKGVDLQLTATAEGFRQVLVVKSADAAANPALEQIKLASSGDGLQIVPGAGGGMRAIDPDGNAVFTGPSGQMWDSAGTPAQPDPAPGPLKNVAPRMNTLTDGASEDDGAHPDKGDTTAELPVQVGEGSVTVTPDLELLRGEKTVYPVYIDPPVGLNASERSVLSSDGDRFWNFNGDYGVGNCSQSGGYYCDRPTHTNRMYFEFAPTQLAGKHVIDATFRAYETWSWDCTARLVNLTRTDNISEGTRWPGPAYRDLMADRWISAGRGSLCSPEQPDQWVEFHDNPAEPDENLTASVRDLANGRFSRLTLRLSAADEGDPTGWKRFEDNAQLQVVYVPKPGTPAKYGIIPNNGTQQYCSTNAATPTTVTIPNPTVQATVETAAQPRTNEERGSLQAEFEVERSSNGQASGTWSDFWLDYRPKPGWHVDGTLEKAPTATLADGGLYRYKARTQSHINYAGKNTELFSGYTPWCYFTHDAGAPKAPVITSVSPYTQCTATVCEGRGGPGVPGTFTFKPNAADKDIKSYRWRLMTSSQAGAKTVAGSAVTVTDVTPSLSGTYVLSVEASDLTAGRVRWGAPAEFTFKVQSPQGPVGQWHFDDTAPGGTGITAKDSATEGARHPATLHQQAGTAATWSTLGRRGTNISDVNGVETVRRDYSLRLNDDIDDPVKRLGYASTAGAPVNSKDSFTLSSWVLLQDDTVNYAVAAAPGTYGSAFTLYYSKDLKKWVFNRSAADVQSSPIYVRSASDASPVKKVWTHLAGVFDTKGDTDKANDTIQLFVNGRPQGSPVKPAAVAPTYTPWMSTGDLQIGRSKALGNFQEYFLGRIDEVRLWQRALSADEVRDESLLAEDSVPQAALVGYWDAAGTVNNVVPEWTSYPVDGMKLSATGATANPENNEVTFDGTSGHLSTNGPAVDETGAFTVTAEVRLDSAKLATKPVGYRAAVFSQAAPGGLESSWSLWVEKVSAEGYLWNFSRTGVDAAGKPVESASAKSEMPAVLDTWTQVTGIYDGPKAPETGNTHLYVEGEEQPGSPVFNSLAQGTGALTVGSAPAGGKTGHFLPGALDEVRVWAGAMTADQVRSKVLGTPGES